MVIREQKLYNFFKLKKRRSYMVYLDAYAWLEIIKIIFGNR